MEAGNTPVTTVWQAVAGFRKSDKTVGIVPTVTLLNPPPPFAIQQQNLQVPRENVEETVMTIALPEAKRDALETSPLPSFQTNNLTITFEDAGAPIFESAATPDPTRDHTTIRRSSRQ